MNIRVCKESYTSKTQFTEEDDFIGRQVRAVWCWVRNGSPCIMGICHVRWNLGGYSRLWRSKTVWYFKHETWLGCFTRKGKIWTSWSCWCGRFLTDETNSELAQMFFPKHRFSNKLRRPLPLSNRANSPPHSAFSSHPNSAPCSVESASELL